MTARRHDQLYLTFYLLLSAAALGYIWIRAFSVQLSIDEAATFFMYIQTGRFLPPGAAVDANNHLLNSLLSWLAYQAGGPDPVILRAPNVLAAVVYFIYTFRISLEIRKLPLRYGFAVLMSGTHFMIEFFGYTRGYGLSLAMLSAALFYTLEAFRNASTGNVFKAFIFILLSVFANLNLIFTGLALTGILGLFIIFDKKSSLNQRIFSRGLPLIVIASVAFAFLISFSLRIREFSGFYYGSPEGFREVTVNTLARFVTGMNGNPAGYLVILIALVPATALILNLYTRRDTLPDAYRPVLFLGLLILNWLGSVVLNRAMGVNFQEDRAAIHYLPLFYAFLFFALDRLAVSGNGAWMLMAIPLVIIPYHSINQIDRYNSLYGSAQQVPEEQFRYIRDTAQTAPWPPVVSAYQIKRLPWAYLNIRHGGILNPLHAANFPSACADFIMTRDSIPAHLQPTFSEIMYEERTSTRLYQRNSPLNLIPVDTFLLEQSFTGTDRYNNLVHFAADSLRGRDILIRMQFRIESDMPLLEGGFIVEVFDSTRKNLWYEPLDIDQLKSRNGPTVRQIRHSIVIENIPQDAHEILLYYWNKQDGVYTLRSGMATLYVIDEAKDPF